MPIVPIAPPQSVPVSAGFDYVTVDALPDTILKRNVFDINGAQIQGLPLHKGNDRDGFIDASDLTLRSCARLPSVR